MRILTLFVRHGRVMYPTALEDLLAFQRLRLPSVHHDVLIVDNDPALTRPDAVGECPVIAGSNRFWEFSAWDEGLAHVGKRVWDYDFVHLVTSAFRTLYTRFIDRFDETTLRRVTGRGIAIGHIDRFNDPVELLGNRGQAWLRSSFILVPPAELAALGSLVSVSKGSDFFSNEAAHPFRKDAPLSHNYRQYIVDWLTGPGTGQGVVWHSRFALTSETLSYFQEKVLAMLNEFMLSVRLSRQGSALLDATWLSSHAARIGRSAAIGVIPAWRHQLAQRDTDAVPLPNGL
jgi:hypothetical protein